MKKYSREQLRAMDETVSKLSNRYARSMKSFRSYKDAWQQEVCEHIARSLSYRSLKWAKILIDTEHGCYTDQWMQAIRAELKERDFHKTLHKALK